MPNPADHLVYLDHAATVPLAPEVEDAMRPHIGEACGNAGATHRLGRRARVALEAARADVARHVGCHADEVVFTSGGTEANNLAVAGILEARATGGDDGVSGIEARSPHVVASAVEHKSVLAAALRAASLHGSQAILAPVDGHGEVRLDDLRAAVGSDTAMVAVMLANNEVGTIQPVSEISRIAHGQGALLHVDAVQAAAWTALDVDELGADTVSLSAHKVGGPPGVGALVVRRGTPIRPQLVGGGQESGMRSGTQNVAGAVGFAAALGLVRDRQDRVSDVAALGQQLLSGLLAVDGVRLTGHPTRRLPGIVSVCVVGVPADLLLLGLDAYGICASSGSACSSGLVEPSHVLDAMGISEDHARGALRLSLGHGSTEGDIERVLDVVPELVRRLREAALGG